MDFKTLAEAGEAYDKLQADHTTQAAEIASLQNTVKSQHDTIEEQHNEIEELQQLVTELRNAKPIFSKPGFIHSKSGKRCLIAAGKIKFNGQEYTAEQIMADENLQDELVNIGAGFIEVQED